MRNALVYDLPTRLFHWIFSILFLTAFAIAKTVDDKSVIYNYHMLIGLTISSLILLRIIWGFVGTRNARFSGFSLRPADLLNYLKGIVSGNKRRWAGHNPASSWAAIAMMTMGLGLGATGFLMTSGTDKETYEDFHELFGNGLMILVILHVVGVILHTIRHREMITLSMIDGKKKEVSKNEMIDSPRTKTGILFLTIVLAVALHLFKHFDSETRRLDFFGIMLQLGDSTEDENGSDS